MLWRENTFCVPGSLLGPEHLDIASFCELASHWIFARANYVQSAEAKGVSKKQRQPFMKYAHSVVGAVKKQHEEPWVDETSGGQDTVLPFKSEESPERFLGKTG